MTETQVIEKPVKPHAKILTSPYAKEKLLNDIATKRVTDVAKQYNVSHPRISQIKAENKEIIERKKAELISLLPSVVDTVQTDINTNNRLSKHIALDFTKADSDLIALKNNLDKTSVNLLKIAGIIQPHMNMLNTGNITVNQQNIVNPSVIKLISQASLEQLDALEIVDNPELSRDNT